MPLKQAGMKMLHRFPIAPVRVALWCAVLVPALMGMLPALSIQPAWAQARLAQSGTGADAGQGAHASSAASAGLEDAVPEDDPWQPEEICPRDQVAPRDYNRCLFDATRTSEQALEAALSRAMTFISGRSDLSPAQRVMWRQQLDEAQYRFIIFRNFDCQSVAPFEGPRGIGNFEHRALCLIRMNRARADDLEQRYRVAPPSSVAQAAAPVRRPPPIGAPGVSAPAQPVAAAPVPEGPEPQLGVWLHPTAPAVD